MHESTIQDNNTFSDEVVAKLSLNINKRQKHVLQWDMKINIVLLHFQFSLAVITTFSSVINMENSFIVLLALIGHFSLFCEVRGC